MKDDIVIRCDNVGKTFCKSLKRSLVYGAADALQEFSPFSKSTRDSTHTLRKDEFWANRNLSFELKRSECVGLIGRNGSGKTTALKLLNGLIKPNEGTITIKGRIGAIIALGAGFSPILSGRENVFVNASILGMPRSEIVRNFDKIVDFAEIGEFIDSPVRNYSSGMKIRLGFAVASHIKPDILLVDEVLAVGDLGFQQKCLRYIENLRQNGTTIILVTHSFNRVMNNCTRTIVLDKGEILFDGQTTEAVSKAITISEDESKADVESSFFSESGLRIQSIDVMNPEGGIIHPLDEAVVRLKYIADSDFEKITWKFLVYTHDNQTTLITSAGSNQGMSLSLKKGKGEIFAKIPSIPLAPNTYCLRATIEDDVRTLDKYGYGREIKRFKIEPGNCEEDIRAYTYGSVVRTKIEW